MNRGWRGWRAVAACAALALIVALAGCGGGSPPPAPTAGPAAPGPEAPTGSPPLVGEAPASVEPTAPVDEPLPEGAPSVESVAQDIVAAAIESMAEDVVDALILSWARDAGGLNHCDRMSVFADGRIEAVVCKAGVEEARASGTLTDEQLATVLSWVGQYASFSRREMEISRAVRTTMLNGTGTDVPASEAKADIAAFAADLFFGLTQPR